MTETGLISRQAAIDALRAMQTYKLSAGDDMLLIDKAEAQTELMMLPTTQTKIVRCKNCKNWDTTWQNDWAKNYHYCPLIDGIRNGDWYCADAERRTDDGSDEQTVQRTTKFAQNLQIGKLNDESEVFMKKLFISVPMRGRTEEAIRKSIVKMHNAAEAIIGEKLKLVESYSPDNEPFSKHEDVLMLGGAIQKMADADYVIGIAEDWNCAGCGCEMDIARKYGIPTITLEAKFVAPDVWNELKKEVSAE